MTDIANVSIENTSALPSREPGIITRVAEWASQRCGSILVKETRQALKSKHFLWTYFILLAAVGVTTVLGIALSDFADEDSPVGQNLLMAYLVVLGVPLIVIIPFSAFRSLSREFEDGTIQLVSITTMKPSQIVIGKFASALLQMLVYLSVLAPCIALTYLLKGIGLVHIGWGLGICVSASTCLTVLGLFLAGAIRSRALSVGISVLFAILLGWICWIWCMICEDLVRETSFGDPDLQLFLFIFLSLFGSTAALLLVAAASQISFPSDNRSTGVRLVMFIQQLIFLAVPVVFLQHEYMDEDVFLAWTMVAAHYWLVMGFLMIGESPELSRRVRRSLPRSSLARSFCSLFMPGPGRGFLYALSMLWGCVVSLAVLLHLAPTIVSLIPNRLGAVSTPIAVISNLIRVDQAMAAFALYASAFLAINYLFARKFLHQRIRDWNAGTGPALNLFLGVVGVFGLTLGSLAGYMMLVVNRADYHASQVFNWYWTSVELLNRGPSPDLAWTYLMFPVLVAIVLWAMFLAARELQSQPVPVPQRVLIDRQTPTTSLPAGESIDEIFGKLNQDTAQSDG